MFLSRTISARRNGAFSFAGMVSSGCASNRNSSEIAVPMRARPKSRAKIGFILLIGGERRACWVRDLQLRNPHKLGFAASPFWPLSLQLRWKLTDQILDLFCFVTVTDQKRVPGSHNNEIMNSKKRDGCSILFENDIVAGIERSDGAIRRVTLRVVLEIICDRPPASDVVPVEACLYHKDPVRLLHNRVIEGDAGQFAEAVT